MKATAREIAKARKDYHNLIKIINQNPGINFREILRARGLGYGTLERQLAQLERLCLLRAQTAGRFTRFYDSGMPKTDIEPLFYLKQRGYREIIRFLLDDANGEFSFQKIVQIIGKAPSTVSVQLARLIDRKLVSFDEKHDYTVNKKQSIKRLISKYRV